MGERAGGTEGGSWPSTQKESQVAKAAERDTRSTGSVGSRGPAAPLPLPQSSNKLPWMLRFLDSFLSLSHISFAPSWQSVRAVTVQLWKSSQYLARNRTKQKKQIHFGRWNTSDLRPCACPDCGFAKPPRAPPPYLASTTLTPGLHAVETRWTLAHPRSAVRGDGPPWPCLFNLLAARRGPGSRQPIAPTASRWHLGLRKQIACPPGES